jgi:hypothetical protein
MLSEFTVGNPRNNLGNPVADLTVTGKDTYIIPQLGMIAQSGKLPVLLKTQLQSLAAMTEN